MVSDLAIAVIVKAANNACFRQVGIGIQEAKDFPCSENRYLWVLLQENIYFSEKLYIALDGSN